MSRSSTATIAESSSPPGHTLHRSEALTDGIYAVAMTLLVIELKVPEHSAVHNAHDLAIAVAQLAPKFIAWLISFFVLAQFWFGHHRMFSAVGYGDGPLIVLNLAQLGFVSLMPFSSALVGEYQTLLLSQVIYSLNMAAMALITLSISRRIHRHPAWAETPIPAAFYVGARVRMLGLCVISATAIGIAMVVPGAGNAAFLLMAVINPLSRRMEARAQAG